MRSLVCSCVSSFTEKLLHACGTVQKRERERGKDVLKTAALWEIFKFLASAHKAAKRSLSANVTSAATLLGQEKLRREEEKEKMKNLRASGQLKKIYLSVMHQWKNENHITLSHALILLT